MSPADHGWEVRYYRASRAAHIAWLLSQPQQVIPGVLEQADQTAVTVGVPSGRSACSSPPGRSDGDTLHQGPPRVRVVPGGLDTNQENGG